MKDDRFDRAHRGAQRGAALIVLMVILVAGTTGILLRGLNVASNNAEIARRADSARVLDEAKQALLGFVASQAATDSNPGRLPCPEAPAYFGTTNAGLSQNDYQVNSANPVGGYCGSGTVVGRLPWRTLGMSKPLDGYGEALWYVISPGFAMPSSGGSLSINSNTAAGLTVNSVSASAVALIIAPGAAMTVETAANCTARAQTRSSETAASPAAPDLRDYLECENATSPADATFVTTGASTSFNDQVVSISQAELFDVVEPVVAKRIETEIAPSLASMYMNNLWSGNTSVSPVATYIYPYAVTFADPTASLFRGSSGVTEGLPPMYAEAGAGTFVYWYNGSSSRRPTAAKVPGSSGSVSGTPSCTATTNTTVSCTITYKNNPRIRITAMARSVARAMRQLNSAAVPLTWADPLPPAGEELKVYAAFDTSTTNGRASVYVEYNLLPDYSGSWITRTVTFPIGILADHPLTDPTNATTGWFVKNSWHHLVYYAFAPNYAANQTHYCNSPPLTSRTCLTVNNLTPTGKQRALLILTGRTLSFQARSTAAQRANRTNYLEDSENRDLDQVFVKNTNSKTYNDRVIVIDSNS